MEGPAYSSYHSQAAHIQWSFWQHKLTIKIVSAHLHFCLFMLIWTKWQMRRKKKNPMKDLAGLNGKSVNIRRASDRRTAQE